MGNNFVMAEQVHQEQEEEEQQQQQEQQQEPAQEEEQQGQVEVQESQEEAGQAESEEGAEAEQEVEEKPKITVDDVKTAPMDFRFPTTNQAKHCYTRYNEFHKCAAEKGEDAKECKKYARFYRSLCPGEWVDKWNEERENGTFTGRY